MSRILQKLGLVLLLVTSVFSIPAPILNVTELADQADLVIVGAVTSVNQQGVANLDFQGSTIQARLMAAEIRVDQVLKGAADRSKIDFQFESPDAPIGYGNVLPASYAIFFLKKAQSGFTLASHYYPSIVAVRGVSATNGGLLDNLSNQLQAVAKASDADISRKEQALYALQTIRTPTATSALEGVLQDKSTDLQLIAAAALLERNDISAMGIAETALTKKSPEISHDLLHNLTYAISEGIEDDRAVPALSRLLRLPSVETRRAAASALWRTRSQSAAGPLAVALNDADFEVRFFAVIGLAEITDQMQWHPNMEVFQAEQTKYLDHWRDWARTNYPQ